MNFLKLSELPENIEAIAVRGASTTLYVKKGSDPKADDAVGILENRTTGLISEVPIQSVLARGYWEAPAKPARKPVPVRPATTQRAPKRSMPLQ